MRRTTVVRCDRIRDEGGLVLFGALHHRRAARIAIEDHRPAFRQATRQFAPNGETIRPHVQMLPAVLPGADRARSVLGRTNLGGSGVVVVAEFGKAVATKAIGPPARVSEQSPDQSAQLP